MQTFEQERNILPLAEVLDQYFTKYPNSQLLKLQLEFEGPFLKYEFVGFDDTNRYTFEINAANGAILKERQKFLKPNESEKLNQKALNITNLLPLTDINQLALQHSELQHPFQWELDRVRERTVWKVELANEIGNQIIEVKLDAHKGTLVQLKLKH
ncbi:hypothetical protein GIY11_00560 [Aerococcaceae bacterium DSM 109653]|uniref:PepSY domain-containing protein n=1 Tax=Fundicoccus ignavus TaxID=2664442 RepID=A0A844BRC7_9LACT|nr:PepSY domain-containing protein [Fundicoccus ignavus]MRI80523.1 hypothetical protein [Fundicoccus ignavus]